MRKLLHIFHILVIFASKSRSCFHLCRLPCMALSVQIHYFSPGQGQNSLHWFFLPVAPLFLMREGPGLASRCSLPVWTLSPTASLCIAVPRARALAAQGTPSCARCSVSPSTPVFTTECWLYPSLFFWTADILKQKRKKKKSWRLNTSMYR